MPPQTAGDSPQATPGDSVFASQAIRQATWRLIPLLAVGYLISYIHRTNIGFAALNFDGLAIPSSSTDSRGPTTTLRSRNWITRSLIWFTKRGSSWNNDGTFSVGGDNVVKPDREAVGIGLDQSISRRDFVSGLATGAAVFAATGATAHAGIGAPNQPDAAVAEIYPPLRTGLRGQYPGSFETAHRVRDGGFGAVLESADTGEHYDLVVVGAGISGLAAAHYYRKALGGGVRILVIDNHDDFGGHAKRNEFRHDGRTYLSFGGTMSIESPFPYSATAKALLAELGVDATSASRYARPGRLEGLTDGVFFDREHFLGDKVVPGWGHRPWVEFFAAAPVSPKVRADLLRIHTTKADFLPGLDSRQKADALKRISYQDFLLKTAGLAPQSLPFFAASGWSHRNNMQIDTCPAYMAWRAGEPGFSGMIIRSDPRFETDVFHFPDGNASIARLLVSRLVPAAFPGTQDQETIILAQARYSTLDLPDNPTRIRLSSTVVRVEHLAKSDRGTDKAVRVVYADSQQLRQVTAGNVILACFNQIIPFIVPDLPDEQRKALHYASKVPMQVSNVLVRNWTPWRRLGVRSVRAPNGYHSDVMLDTPLEIGGHESVRTPQDPIVVQMVRNPHAPGLPRRDQNRAGRAQMLATPFEEIERQIRLQLNRMFGPAGFDAQRDILAITVNRWPHGYAYTYDTLGDPDLSDAERPHVIGRRQFGRIAIANADSGAAAYTNVAIDQAERAILECLASRGLT